MANDIPPLRPLTEIRADHSVLNNTPIPWVPPESEARQRLLADIPALVAEVERLRADNEQLRQANEHWHTRVQQMGTELKQFRIAEADRLLKE